MYYLIIKFYCDKLCVKYKYKIDVLKKFNKQLDCSALEYCLNVENMNLSAIRTIRVLRPLRAINRIPSK